MNNPFLNRLANILDGLPPYQLSHEASYCDAHYRDVETGMAIDAKPVLHNLDRFFMTGDVRDSDFEPSWIPWEGNTCGNLEAWAALTAAREQDIPLPLSQEAVARIAAEALDLPEPPAGTVLLTSLSPILNPACLLGRFDAVTPQHAASVLRACADGQSPVEAWNHVSLNIRNQRLLELADMVKDLPSTSDDHFPTVDELWTPHDLRSHLSTLILDPSQGLPFVMNDGSWGWQPGPLDPQPLRGLRRKPPGRDLPQPDKTRCRHGPWTHLPGSHSALLRPARSGHGPPCNQRDISDGRDP